MKSTFTETLNQQKSSDRASLTLDNLSNWLEELSDNESQLIAGGSDGFESMYIFIVADGVVYARSLTKLWKSLKD